MKMMKRALIMTGILAVPAVCSAQEAGKVGVTMGFPAAVGVIWHATEKVAIRPDFTFSFSSSESRSGETTTRGIGVGVSALFYLKKWDNVSSYLSPRFGWTSSKTTLPSFSILLPIDPPFPFNPDTERTTNIYSFSGSMGAQAWIGNRFSVFGEAGLAYSKNVIEEYASFGSLDAYAVGTRAGVGVVLYF